LVIDAKGTWFYGGVSLFFLDFIGFSGAGSAEDFFFVFLLRFYFLLAKLWLPTCVNWPRVPRNRVVGRPSKQFDNKTDYLNDIKGPVPSVAPPAEGFMKGYRKCNGGTWENYMDM